MMVVVGILGFLFCTALGLAILVGLVVLASVWAFDNWLKKPPPGPAKWGPGPGDFYGEIW